MAERDETPWGCGIMRYEAEGYADSLAWLEAQPPALLDAICATVPPPPAGWEAMHEALDSYAWAECELDEGHVGPHRFAGTLAVRGGNHEP